MKRKKLTLFSTFLLLGLSLSACSVNVDGNTSISDDTTPTSIPTTTDPETSTPTSVTPTDTPTSDPIKVTPTSDPVTSTPVTDPVTSQPVTDPITSSTDTPTTSTSSDIITSDDPVVVSHNVKLYIDGTLYDDFMVEDGKLVNLPTPTKENYTFSGWYFDTNCETTPYNNTNVTSDLVLYAKYTLNENFNEINLNVTEYNEGINITFNLLNSTSLSDYTVTYKKTTDSSYKTLDRELIRLNDDEADIDIIGLSAGTYDVVVRNNSNVGSKIVNVTKDDRSGYAHFNNSNGVGAYNNDGTLKNNAIVVYVSNATKNTVTAKINNTTYTGLVDILKHANSNYPLDIRILDRIETCQFNNINYTSSRETPELLAEQAASLGGNYSGFSASDIINNGWNSYSNDIASGITELNGLSSKCSYSSGEFDSAWNNCSISGVSNVTVEGIGYGAEIFQWGFTWNKCNSIEVKNITFTDYTEDACSFQGGSNSDMNYKNFWVHNCTFNIGKNNWDLTYEQDKHYGDGATDFKYLKNVTSSYNLFDSCKKTGLVGGSNSNYTMNITFHHNYYKLVGSRLPLGRQANMHIYNNYYYSCSTCQDIRANAFVLSEYNYFYACNNPQSVNTSDGAQTVIKSYNDVLSGCGDSQATTVDERDEQLSGNCKPDGSTNYTNFDTNTSLFYYDDENNCSDVELLNENSDVPTVVPLYAGAGKYPSFDYSDTISHHNSSTNTNTDTEEPEEPEEPVVYDGDTVFYTLNDFTAETLSSNKTDGTVTVTIKSGKTIQIKTTNQTLNNTSVTKYLSVGGAGNYNEASIQFNVTGECSIKVYYASGSSGRYVALYNSDNEQIGVATTPTNGTSGSTVNYTFTNIEAGSYAIASSNSGLEIYMIEITYK